MREDTACPQCQGTILPRGMRGNERGTCVCRRPGVIYGRSFYATAPSDPPLRWEYEVTWNGEVLPEKYSTLAEAEAHLEVLRRSQ